MKGPARVRGLETAEREAARARAILDSARDAIITIDSRGTVVDFNGAAEKTFGYAPSEVIGNNVAMLMPSPYREEHDGYIERYESTGEAKAIGRIREVVARRKDGEVFPMELSVAEVATGGERIYTGIVRDVSAYRKALEALRHERDFNELLLDTTPTIILVLDPDARVVSFNRFMAALSGHSLEDTRGRDWFDTFVRAGDRESARRVIADALTGKTIRGYISPILTSSGDERLIRWHSDPLRSESGRITGILCWGEDITDQRHAEAELERVERLARERERLADVGAIAARLVHDIGNPVSGLSMQAELLMRRVRKISGEDADAVVRPAQRIMSAVAGLNELVRGFMDFAREQRLDLSDVDVEKLVGDVVELWQPVAASMGITLVFQPVGGLRSIRGDMAKLRRVFDNLVKNALEAVGTAPGNVEVRVETSPGDGIAVCVADDGSGVEKDADVFRLFETTKPDGTGIGLAVAKQIVLAHGGSIDHEAATPRGTRFRVALPHSTEHLPR